MLVNIQPIDPLPMHHLTARFDPAAEVKYQAEANTPAYFGIDPNNHMSRQRTPSVNA